MRYVSSAVSEAKKARVDIPEGPTTRKEPSSPLRTSTAKTLDELVQKYRISLTDEKSLRIGDTVYFKFLTNQDLSKICNENSEMMDAVLHVAIFRYSNMHDIIKRQWEELPKSFEPGFSAKSGEWHERCRFLAEEISRYQASKGEMAARKVAGTSLLDEFLAERDYAVTQHNERMKNLRGKA